MILPLAFTLIFFSRVLFLSVSPAFYDSWEYLQAFESPSLWAALKMVHYPIHPLFISLGWLINRIPLSTTLFKAEFFQGLCSFVSAIVFYKICLKLSLDIRKSLLLTLIFSFLPFIWLASINLVYESLLVLLILLSFLFLKKSFLVSGLFFLLAFLVSPVALFYLPLAEAYLFEKQKRNAWQKYLLISVIYLLGGFIVYYLITRIRGGNLLETFKVISSGGLLVKKAFEEGWLFFPRMVRNALVIYFNYLTVPLGLFLLILALISWQKNILTYFFWSACFLTVSFSWHLGMYGRLAIFLIIPLLFLLLKVKNKYLFLIWLWLLIFSARLVIPYHFQKTPYVLEKEYFEEACKNLNPLLVISNYEQPYLSQNFEAVVLNIPDEDLKKDQEKIDQALAGNRLVLFTSQAVTTPYWQYDGMNYHILSERKNFPQTKGQVLFRLYQSKVFKEWLEINLRIYQLIPPQSFPLSFLPF